MSSYRKCHRWTRGYKNLNKGGPNNNPITILLKKIAGANTTNGSKPNNSTPQAMIPAHAPDATTQTNPYSRPCRQDCTIGSSRQLPFQIDRPYSERLRRQLRVAFETESAHRNFRKLGCAVGLRLKQNVKTCEVGRDVG